MSINEMDSKIKELRELRRMADELVGEIESITNSIKAHMDAEGVDTINGTDWKVTYKAILLLSPFLSYPGVSTGKIPPELSLIR